MPSYLITGVSRGLGYEFLKQLSSDKNNTIVGLARNKQATEAKVDKELGRLGNVTILQADMTDYDSLKNTVPDVEKATGGKLDYILANAAYFAHWSAFRTYEQMSKSPERLDADLIDSFKANVVGNIHLFNLFIPLVLKGDVKKVVTIGSAQGDVDLIVRTGVVMAAPYCISKAAMNMAVAKFSAQYVDQGVLFTTIAPGDVDTGYYNGGDITDDIKAVMADTGSKFKAFAPHYKGSATPEDAVKDVLDTIRRASIERGYAGDAVSQFGNKQWL